MHRNLTGDIVAAGCDFTIAFWYRTDADPGSNGKTFLCRDSSSILEPHTRFYVGLNAVFCRAGWGGGPCQYVTLATGPGPVLMGQRRNQGQSDRSELRKQLFQPNVAAGSHRPGLPERRFRLAVRYGRLSSV